MSKKVLILSGSPRKGGNSDILCEQFQKGAEEAGNVVEKVDLRSLKIGCCMACYGCRGKGVCVQKDDMTPLYEKINAADAVIIGSPIYFGENTGQIKCFVDRMYAFLGPEGSKMKAGKKAVAVITQGMADVKVYENCAGILTAGFRYCGAAIEAPLIVGELHSAEDLKAEALAAAEQLGKKLAN